MTLKASETIPAKWQPNHLTQHRTRPERLEQAEKVVKKNLDDNPARLHMPASLLILDALGEAFPCKR
jgi:hypothetical protein